MCTVTYVPSSSGYFLTSNRDEKNTRTKAQSPAHYWLYGNRLIFPKDGDAGGTWIVLKENGDSLCLLNGAFETFIDKGLYNVSRGKIVTDIAAASNLIYAFDNILLEQTAPFTLIIVNEKKLFECRWDGEQKYYKKLDNSAAHIWSSTTLYDNAQQAERKNWFEQWQKDNIQPLQKDVLDFHTNSGAGNVADNLIMNRNDLYFTVSITGISVSDDECLMHYQDIVHDEYSTTSFTFERAIG